MTKIRRRLQFSLRTMMAATALLTAVFAWPHLRRNWAFDRLHAYAGRDLRELPAEEHQQVSRWIELVVGTKDDGFPQGIIDPNWLLHRSPFSGHLYVVQVDPVIEAARIQVLTWPGRVLCTLPFQTGYRATPVKAAFEEPEEGFLCLSIETDAVLGGVSRQYYRITDEYVELLRREHLDGRFFMGRGNGYDLHLKPPDWEQWPKLLASGRRIDQLRGLAAFWSWDNLQQIERVDEQTVLQLERLSHSDDPWINEESRFALKWLAAPPAPFYRPKE